MKKLFYNSHKDGVGLIQDQGSFGRRREDDQFWIEDRLRERLRSPNKNFNKMFNGSKISSEIIIMIKNVLFYGECNPIMKFRKFF